MKYGDKISNEMVIAAQKGDEDAVRAVARCFSDIARVKWHASRALQIARSLEDFQQEVAVYWWRYLRGFNPARAKATTWSFMIVLTVLRRVLQFDNCQNRKPRGQRRPMFEVAGVRMKKTHDEVDLVKVRAAPGLRLSEREVEILTMFARGKTMAQIARSLGLSREQVRHHKLDFRTKFVDTRPASFRAGVPGAAAPGSVNCDSHE